MNAPLYKRIKEYEGARFHTPSHNGKEIVHLYSSAKYDITELSFSDNLLFSKKGIIAEAERLAACAYKTAYSRFFTSGATSAIQTAILVLEQAGLMPLVVGECHVSVYNALKLFNIKYKKAEILSKKALQGTQAVILTSPDVYGVVQDVKSIKEKIGNRLLVVDESHGAHYAFSSLLPVSATKYADITINSMHKTLPCYTGAAILHTKEQGLDRKVVCCRRLVHTTSPSYLVMASMDWARAYFEKNGEEVYKAIYKEINKLKLPNGYTVQKNDDFSRLVINTNNKGKEVYKAFERAGFFAEMYDVDRVVLIVTPYNVDKLSSISDILKQNITKEKPKIEERYYLLIGQVAKSDIGLFPPCVPIIQKGDTITVEKLQKILDNLQCAYGLDYERYI